MGQTHRKPDSTDEEIKCYGFLTCAHIKGTTEIFKPSFYHLSPCQGACLLNSLFLKNLYNYGEDKSPTAQFVRNLFHQHTLGEPLEVTSNKSKAAFYLTPQRIGLWISLEERRRLGLHPNFDSLIHPWYKISRCSKKHLDEHIQLFRQINENNEFSIPHLGTTILLAVLWAKSQSKSCLEQYVLALTEKHTALFLRDADLEVDNEQWKRQKFDPGDCNTTNPQEINSPSEYEKMCYKALLGKFNHYPPALDSEHIPFQGHNKPDCAERGLRGLLNVVLFNIQQQNLDVGILEELQANEELITFYKEFSPTCQDAKTRHCSIKWFEFLANRPNFSYLMGKIGDIPFEVRPSLANLLVIFQFFFPKTTITKWEDVGVALSSSYSKVSVELLASTQQSDSGTLVFSVSYAGTTLITQSSLEVRYNNHTYLTHPSPKILISAEDIVYAWKRSRNGSSQRCIHCVPLALLMLSYSGGFVERLIVRVKSKNELLKILYSLSLGPILLRRIQMLIKSMGTDSGKEEPPTIKKRLSEEFAEEVDRLKKAMETPYIGKRPIDI